MAKSQEILDTIDLFYQAGVDAKLWPDALQRLAEVTGGLGTAMIPITPGKTAGLVVSPALEEPNVEYSREWWQHDSRVLRIFSRRLTDGVCCEAELFTREEVARDPLRQEFCRKHGIGSFAAQLVMPLPDFVVAFSVQRPLASGEFERHELDTLGLLGRHAARALLVSTRLAAAQTIERTLTDALARLDCGAFVVDRQLRVLFANAEAARIIGDGLSLQQGQLQASARQHRTALVRLMKSVLQTNGGADHLAPIALARPDGRPLLVQAIPVRQGDADLNLPSAAAALVLVVDPEQDSSADTLSELILLGLTRAEARIAALVGSGHSRNEAAATLGISEWTAHDTMKLVYAKLGITRQSELVRLVDRLAVLRVRRPHAGRPRRAPA